MMAVLLSFVGGAVAVIALEVMGLHSLLAPYYDVISFMLRFGLR